MVSVHPYRSTAPETALRDLQMLQAMMANYTDAKLPIIAGERASAGCDAVSGVTRRGTAHRRVGLHERPASVLLWQPRRSANAGQVPASAVVHAAARQWRCQGDGVDLL